MQFEFQQSQVEKVETEVTSFDSALELLQEIEATEVEKEKLLMSAWAET